MACIKPPKQISQPTRLQGPTGRGRIALGESLLSEHRHKGKDVFQGQIDSAFRDVANASSLVAIAGALRKAQDALHEARLGKRPLAEIRKLESQLAKLQKEANRKSDQYVAEQIRNNVDAERIKSRGSMPGEDFHDSAQKRPLDKRKQQRGASKQQHDALRSYARLTLSLARFGLELSVMSNGGFNLLPESDEAGRKASELPALPGFVDVIIHGTKPGAEFCANGGPHLQPKDLAEIIRALPIPTDKPIRLLACHAGKFIDSAAQDVADALGRKVMAPTGTLVLRRRRSGRVFTQIGPAPLQPRGRWRIVTPRKQEN
jgi:hypothetical protein